MNATEPGQIQLSTLQLRLRGLVRERQSLEMDLAKPEEIDSIEQEIERTRRQINTLTNPVPPFGGQCR